MSVMPSIFIFFRVFFSFSSFSKSLSSHVLMFIRCYTYQKMFKRNVKNLISNFVILKIQLRKKMYTLVASTN